MIQKKSTKIILFLIIPILIAGVSFFYNFAGYLFSAGPLTRGHKEFDNSCFKCHMPLVSVSTSCLSCHKDIKHTLDDKHGFHGNMDEDDAKKCLSCHTDHKGPEHLIIVESRTSEEIEKNLRSIIERNPRVYEGVDDKVNPQYSKFWPKIQEVSSWTERIKLIQDDFEHKLTGYPLTGKHAKIKCQECHTNIKDFKESDKEGILPAFSLEKVLKKDFCLSCHKKDDDSKKGHKGKYGKDCAACHTLGNTEKGWKVLVPKIGRFHEDPKHKLEGKHQKVSCKRCHETAPFKKKEEEKTCFHCHEKLDKKYHDQSLGKKCESCHNPESFRKSTFDHQKTKFPLVDSHKKTGCQKCHPDWSEKKKEKKIYKKIENPTCFKCHAREDIHHGSFKTTCEDCHRETFWGDIKR